MGKEKTMKKHNTVSAPCPRCYRIVDFQSKAGKYNSTPCTIGLVPVAIAEDIKHNKSKCKCGFVLQLAMKEVELVEMTVLLGELKSTDVKPYWEEK